MRLLLLMITFISLTMVLKVHGQEVISARAPSAAERIASMKHIATNIAVGLKDPIQPLLGIRLLRVTTNSVIVANLVSDERYELRLMNENIDTEMGIVQLKRVDTKQGTAVFTLLKGLHRALPSDSMLMPANNISGEQSDPGPPPQGVGSPEP